jgi:hypothetical protein
MSGQHREIKHGVNGIEPRGSVAEVNLTIRQAAIAYSRSSEVLQKPQLINGFRQIVGATSAV